MDIPSLLAKMSLEEKCALLSGKDTFKSRDFKAYGIPQMWLSDGPHGLRKQAGASDHLGLAASEPATCFPTAATVSNSWDPALGEAIGEAIGEEAAAQKVSVVLGPGLNMKRSPLCGRNFEYFSEDPYLAGKLAAGYVRGLQKNGLGACPKHFAANSQEMRRMASDSILDERTLREIYLTGFEIVVKESAPKSIMTSYNLINGEYANENKHLLVDILKNDWGFDGMMVTDWGGSNDHALGVKLGSALEMPAPGGGSVRELLDAVKSGKITEADIDARAAEVLRLVMSTYEVVRSAPDEFDIPAHHAMARRAAAESAVLLKNEGGILPLAAGAKVAVIGDFANTPRYQGAGSSVVNPTKLDTPLEAIKVSGLEVVGYEQGFERHGGANEELCRKAVALAGKCDVVLLYLGLDEISESEGLDRQHMKLAENQVYLLEQVAKANSNVVVVLSAGSPVEMPWLDQCKALLHGYLCGQAGAGAIADLLTGKLCPSGKLAETYPLRYEDTPAYRHFPGEGLTVEYREGLYIGYRYYETANVPVLFPFGYGLSYTTFAYSDLKADAKQVSFTITNTGKVAGAEIAQLYVAKPDAKVFRPVQELKGFARVELAPGESKTVTIPLDDKAFRYWNVLTDRWEVEGGRYELRVGASSADIRLTASVELPGTGAPDPYAGKPLDAYRTAQVQDVPDEVFTALLDHPIPPAEAHKITRNSPFRDLNHSRSPIAWIVWAVLTHLMKKSLASGKPDLNVLFIYNMPLRALAKMTGGMVDMAMVDGLVMELNGFWIIGLLRTLFAFIRNMILNVGFNKRMAK